MTSKLATCGYCGTRTVLNLQGKDRQELICSNCGAPLEEITILPVDAKGKRKPAQLSSATEPARKVKRKKKKPRRKSQDFLEEIWDEIEDVFDIFD